jgi:hypothetical protein
MLQALRLDLLSLLGQCSACGEGLCDLIVQLGAVTMTKVQLPGFVRRIFCAKYSIERLLPEPCVCQKTPSLPRVSAMRSTAATARLTPRNW